ncbi:hypothetical protein BC834DRAFT_661855 [Gloeopeniophorella convolvens]|nr:hypothetical protein BC834DRAFT_661855 [Gloeopeniophorella convolvens]
MRSLFLHLSALNEDEYALFTSSLTDLVASDTPPLDDEQFEKQSVSIREARAWLRGRYADLPVTDLDEILRLFAPSPGQDPILSGGQFFAVLRLVLHLRSGAELDRGLVFKQVFPNSQNEPVSPTRPVNDRPSRQYPAPPRRRQSAAGTAFDAPTPDINPFTPTNYTHDLPQPPVHPDLRTGTISSPTIVPAKPPPPPPPATPPAYTHHASNPFVARAAAAATTRTDPSPERKIPPLPPRKAPPVLPPRSTSLLVSAPGGSLRSKPPPPPLPSKVPHLTTSLMKQSLQASKAGQDAKRMEAQREQERILQVLKSSTRSVSPPKRSGLGSSSSRSSSDGIRPSVPTLPPRPRVSPPGSIVSTRSFEQVAGASLSARQTRYRSPSPLQQPQSRPRSPSRSPSPSRPTTDLPPPVHPNRKTLPADFIAGTASVTPPSPRLGRSKSVHHTSPPPVPRRRRPDSVQVLPSSGETPPSTPAPHTTLGMSSMGASSGSPSRPRVARHLSLSAREPRWDDMRGALSAVRYKAEAGLSRRGWVPGLDHDERLIDGRRGGGGGDGGGGGGGRDLPSASSSEDGLGVDADSLTDEQRRGGPLERDEMKWPTGNGWKPLA